MNSCAKGFLFDLIVEVVNKNNSGELEGILGMWTGDHPESDQEEILMNGMGSTSALDKKIFSVHMGNEWNGEESYIDFGTPDEDAMSDPAELVYIDSMDGQPWWAENWTGVRLSDGSEYSIPETFTITDTGASCFIGPAEVIGTIYEDVLKDVPSKVW